MEMDWEVGKYRMTSLRCFFFHLFLFRISVYFHDCSATDKISFTEPLRDPGYIVSSGGTFKLGFFSPENTTNRYLGIMFNTPEPNVVWVANRDRPLNDSSGALSISGDGNLVVLDGKKETLWSSNASNSKLNSSAQLLNDGNLVLRDTSNGGSLWESFQNPIDTLLVGMKIGGSEDNEIKGTSWRSFTDPSSGSFTLGVNPQQIPEISVWNGGELHWRSGPWDGSVFIGVPGMAAEYGNGFNLETSDVGTFYFSYGNTHTAILLHYKLSFSGAVEEKSLNEKGGWEVSYSTATSECDVYGKCGPNGICDPKGRRICSCLKGFEPKDGSEWNKGNWSAGCFRKALLLCDRNSSSGDPGEADGFLKLSHVKVPHKPNLVQTQEFCDTNCLNNCSCMAVTYVFGIGCMQWSDNLIDTQQFSMYGSDLYIRAAYLELDHGSSKQKKKVIISVTVSVGCILLAVASYFLWNRLIKHRGSEVKVSLTEVILEKSKLEELPLYSYEAIANATDHFLPKNRLGQGGFGPVYQGKLLTGQEVAVKRLSNSSSQGIKEFMNEVNFISKLQHRNLVRLLGCCVEGEEKMLVYEFMPNKSLDAYLFDSGIEDILDWKRRCIIIDGIGRGLLYLHRDSRLRIIHRDLKASNILLDEEMNPKISDFGLARIFGGKQDQENTNRVVGTYGYMAPEYAMGGKFSEKSDVYSFGVLLLEVVSGRKNTSFYHDKENLSLLGYAWKLWNENEALNMAFTDIIDPSVEMEIHRCVQVGLLCVQDSPSDRPGMFSVLLMLNSEIRELPLPKLPVYTAVFSLHGEPDYPQSRLSNNDVSFTEVQGR